MYEFKFTGSSVLWQWRMMQNLKKAFICLFKIDMRNVINFDSSTWKYQKICTLMGCLWPKYMFKRKKYRWVMFDSTEYWWKIWRKTDLCFRKWHEEFGEISPEYLEASKLGLLWDLFIQSTKLISLKLTGELCVMTRNNDANFEE